MRRHAAPLSATLPGSSRCDVLVVGAGPAGCAAAITAARRGADVLLLERHAMPRPKVCGCCVSPRARDLLARLGLDAAPLGVGLVEARVAGWGRSARIPLTTDLAVERAPLDAALAAVAVDAGARVCHPAHVRSVSGTDERTATVATVHGSRQVVARFVIAADGLAGRILPGGARRARRIGVGGIVADPPTAFEAGVVWMAAGSDGYVGAVRLVDGRLNVAASLRVGVAGDLAAAIDRVLASAALPPLPPTAWRGTPALRRRRRALWGQRTLVCGDAAGFWEPFTGEGIAWALEAGQRAGVAAVGLARDWSEPEARAWSRAQRRWLGGQQRGSRAVAAIAASPVLGTVALEALARRPEWARRCLPGRGLGAA